MPFYHIHNRRYIYTHTCTHPANYTSLLIFLLRSGPHAPVYTATWSCLNFRFVVRFFLIAEDDDDDAGGGGVWGEGGKGEGKPDVFLWKGKGRVHRHGGRNEINPTPCTSRSRFRLCFFFSCPGQPKHQRHGTTQSTTKGPPSLLACKASGKFPTCSPPSPTHPLSMFDIIVHGERHVLTDGRPEQD